MTIAQMLQSALDHHRAGRLPQAERLYRAILAEQPQNPDTLHLLGVLANQTGHPKEAAELIQRAITQKPSAEFYFNLAGALNPAGQRDRAIDAMRQAISLNPKWIDAYANLGVMLHQSGQFDAAIAAFRQAIALHPQKFELHFNLGNGLADSQQYDAALNAYATALRLNPKSYETLINRGNTLRLLARLEESLADFQQAESLNPTSPAPGSAYLFALQFHSDDPDLILSEHKKWNNQHAVAFTPSPGTPARSEQSRTGEGRAWGVERTQNAERRTLKDPLPTPPPEYKGRELALASSSSFTVQRSAFPDRRLRIGYVSPEFRAHCQSLFTTALLPQHDHEQFEIFCYSCIPMPDATTDFLKQHADVWRPITNVPDPTVAEQIRNDKIDILVDLTMHMANSRLLLFARKPAPIQACWLAYPGTTGLSAMDYRLTDPHLDPPGFENRYTERSIHLPDTFWCYNPYGMSINSPDALPEVNELPALKNGYITFGCLNDFSKINLATLHRWGKIMQSVPHSRLRLLAPYGQRRQWVLDQMQQCEISPDRIEFADRQPRIPYLAEYHKIDLCLDTLPYNGHTTSLDAFWMGVPVLTQIGKIVVGRAGLSQLTNLQLLQFVTEDEEQFHSRAIEWANNLDGLAEIRRTLRDRMSASPLMDAKRFAQNMETAYQQMWHNFVDS